MSDNDYQIVARICGNCGKVHESIKEWQECAACGPVKEKVVLEHRILTCNFGGPNGYQVAIDHETRLNNLGSQGWELVTVIEDRGVRLHYMKRRAG